MKLSLILCTYNPRIQYLTRIFDALNSQSLSIETWELLLIDNGSDNEVLSNYSFDWHPNYKYIHEEKLGLTQARIRGIKESNSDLLVFVDDDNELYPDYLENAQKISQEYPFLGAWGGQCIPEFEDQPPEWTKPYWIGLAIREFNEDKWSNLVNQYETTPCGAGMCIRRNVAEYYIKLVKNDPIRITMDREGNKLISYGDSDMAFTACDMGYGIGLFTGLKLKHLMPKERFREEYLLKLVEACSYSQVIVESYRGKIPDMNRSWQSKIADIYRYLRMSSREKRFHNAHNKGLKSAIRELSRIKINNFSNN